MWKNNKTVHTHAARFLRNLLPMQTASNILQFVKQHSCFYGPLCPFISKSVRLSVLPYLLIIAAYNSQIEICTENLIKYKTHVVVFGTL